MKTTNVVDHYGLLSIAIALIGGFVLLIPFMEFRMREKTEVATGSDGEIRELRAAVEILEDKLRVVSERQEFIESVLEARSTEPPRLSR